jgi:hypothetical protein
MTTSQVKLAVSNKNNWSFFAREALPIKQSGVHESLLASADSSLSVLVITYSVRHE